MIITCASLPSRYSIHTEYVQAADMWIVRTENGLTGVDEGLIDLLRMSGHFLFLIFRVENRHSLR